MNILLLILATAFSSPAKAEQKTYTCELRSANARSEDDTTLIESREITSGIAETASIVLMMPDPLIVGVTTGYAGITRIDLVHLGIRAAAVSKRWNDMDPPPAVLVDQSADMVYSANCFIP